MNDSGWIKLNRKILKWGWYLDNNTKNLFIHCLLMANYEEQEFQGVVIPRGSFVTSVSKLSQQTKMTVQQVRTAIEHLKLTNEITIKTTNKYTIISVNKYDEYQDINQEDNNQLTNKQQTTNKQVTTIKEIKNIRNKEYKKEEIYKEERKTLKRFIKPSLEEVTGYCNERNNNIDPQTFIDYYESNGWKVGRNPMKDWKATIRTWEKNNFRSESKSKGETKKWLN